MRGTIALIWKEWREQRWLLLAALTIFLGLPLIEATARYMRPPGEVWGYGFGTPRFYSDMATGLVLGFGGLLAILVAVGATSRDLRDELHIFWRSRPIGVGAWISIKYVAGLFTVLLACTLPMLMQAWMTLASPYRLQDEVVMTIGIHTFAIVLIYSVAFLIGCVVRHATHAALLSLAAALLIYFLPIIVAPLGSVSVFNLMMNGAVSVDRYGQSVPDAWSLVLSQYLPPIVVRREMIVFAAAMLGGSVAAAVLAWITVRKDWRLEADRKTMHWALGGVALLLFGATAFQLGSNLKIERQFSLPMEKLGVANLATGVDGSRGALLLRGGTAVDWYSPAAPKLCSYEITSDGTVRFGPIITGVDEMNVAHPFNPNVLFWRAEQPERALLLVEQSGNAPRKAERTVLELQTIDLTGRASNPVLHRLDLQPLLASAGSEARAHHVGDRLFIAGRYEVAVVNLSGPDGPRVESVLDMRGFSGSSSPNTTVNPLGVSPAETTDAAGRQMLDILLPPLPHLSPHQRLAARMQLAMENERFAYDQNNDLLARLDRERLAVYRLASIDEESARFELASVRPHTPLERATGKEHPSKLTLLGNMLYCNEHWMAAGFSVYDLSDPARPLAAGHFATPHGQGLSIASLPNNRLLVTVNQMFVLKVPAPAAGKRASR